LVTFYEDDICRLSKNHPRIILCFFFSLPVLQTNYLPLNNCASFSSIRANLEIAKTEQTLQGSL
jgi:hypothetical protein